MPHWCIIFDTVRLAVFAPKRLGYRFNCYYRQRYYDYADRDDSSNSFSIMEYHRVSVTNSKNIFSASLYGDMENYIDNVINIAQMIHSEYDNWILRVYVDINVDISVIDNLIKLNNDIEIFIINDTSVNIENPAAIRWNSAGMFWRFLPLIDNTVNFLSIDLDETDLKQQGIERDILSEWLSSDENECLFFRTIISNPWPWPKTHVTGKAWGKKKCLSANCPIINKTVFENYSPKHRFGSDEIFIATKIYPLMKKHGLCTEFADVFAKIFFTLLFQNSQITEYNAEKEIFMS